MSTIDYRRSRTKQIVLQKEYSTKTRHVVNATVTITELWRRRLECKIGSNYTIEEASDTNPRKIVLDQDTEKHARILQKMCKYPRLMGPLKLKMPATDSLMGCATYWHGSTRLLAFDGALGTPSDNAPAHCHDVHKL